MITIRKATLAILALGVAAPLSCRAESSLQAGAGSPLTARAHVDLQITIPKFLFLRVGTGTGTAAPGSGWAGNPAIDLISWAPTPAQLGTGALAGTGGDLTGGVETAAVVANHGNVTLSSTTSGALGNGAGNTISYATITTTATKLTTATTLPAPPLASGATRTVVVAAVKKIVQRDARWTYRYTNATIPPAGTYGGVNVNNGRVTYTASVP